MTNSWRALAKMARDRLVETDPEDLDLVLSVSTSAAACLPARRPYQPLTPHSYGTSAFRASRVCGCSIRPRRSARTCSRCSTGSSPHPRASGSSRRRCRSNSTCCMHGLSTGRATTWGTWTRSWACSGSARRRRAQRTRRQTRWSRGCGRSVARVSASSWPRS